jgi:hypothetical protein
VLRRFCGKEYFLEDYSELDYDFGIGPAVRVCIVLQSRPGGLRRITEELGCDDRPVRLEIDPYDWHVRQWFALCDFLAGMLNCSVLKWLANNLLYTLTPLSRSVRGAFTLRKDTDVQM